MMTRSFSAIACVLLASTALLASCGKPAAPDPMAGHDHMTHGTGGPAHHPMVGAIPGNLSPFGEGYPRAGDPCRRLGDSAATALWRSGGTKLVGCPSEAAAEGIGGRIVGKVDAVTIVAVPAGDADTATNNTDAPLRVGDYNATATIRCGMNGAAPASACKAGVKRKWGKDGTTLVEVTKPSGARRALFFHGASPSGADRTEADGSAAWTFTSTREGEAVTIHFGPETYIVPDKLVAGK